MSRFVKNSPTSVISTYKKQFSKDSDSTNSVFNPSQKELGDSSDSIKRYLEKQIKSFPVLDGVLFENVEYANPRETIFLKHNLGRPYRGIDIISVKAPQQYKFQGFKQTVQSVTVGTIASVTFSTTASFDPFSSFSSPVLTAPFSFFGDFSITIHRQYPGIGSVGSPVFDEFWLENTTLSGAVLGSKKRIYRSTATTSLLDSNETLVCLDKQFTNGQQYTVKFECNAFTQNIMTNTDNVTMFYVRETATASPRINGVLDDSGSGFDRNYFVPIISDKGCVFSCVVY